jgi:hypothetical protein
MASNKRIHQMTIGQWEKAFPDDDACRTYLVARRWPLGVKCPRCGNTKVKPHGTRAFNWQCYGECSAKGTSYRFSVIAGTIFENTKYPLRQWFRVIHMMLTSKKGVSALQIHRTLGTGSYETAWSMCHRIRAGLANEDFRKLMGVVEVDETYIGGDDNNRHFGKKTGRNWRENRFAVVGAVERKGKVVARVLDSVNTLTLETFVRHAVGDEVSLIATAPRYGLRINPPSLNFSRSLTRKSAVSFGLGNIPTMAGGWL